MWNIKIITCPANVHVGLGCWLVVWNVMCQYEVVFNYDVLPPLFLLSNLEFLDSEYAAVFKYDVLPPLVKFGVSRQRSLKVCSSKLKEIHSWFGEFFKACIIK